MKTAVILFAAGLLWFSTSSKASGSEAIPGQFVVKLKDSSAASSKSDLEKILGSPVRSIFGDGRLVLVERPLLEVENTSIKILSENQNVQFAEPNFIYHVEKTPHEAQFGKQWGLLNLGQDDSKNIGTAGMDIGAEKAWDLTTGSEDVVIAIIDTGVDQTHPDLATNVWTNQIEAHGLPGVDDDHNGYVDDINGFNFSDPAKPNGNSKDDHGHGSHCAGVIGAKSNDGKGIVGVNWKVKLMAVKFLNADGGGSLDAAVQAIDYAIKMKAQIMSNSWGGGGESLALKEAIERAEKAGILFVAAAGNNAISNDSSPHYPSSYDLPNILSVAAIDNSGQLAAFSNFGKKSVHVAAPGVNIFSSVLNNSYELMSGTSMATPFVSGIAGLLAAQFPEMTYQDLKKRIVSTARPLTSLRGKVFSGGLARADAALTNHIFPADPNDPAIWKSQDIKFSTAHPYGKKQSLGFEISVPGARELALYFDKFDTEKGYDKLSVFNRNGVLITELSGNWDESFSPSIPGDYARLIFTSDDTVEKYGFDLSKVSFR